MLWASTSTKDPKLSDVYYVEELIGPDTVNTIPPATLDAFRDHGKPRASLEENVAGAQEVMDALAKSGVSMKAVTEPAHRRRRQTFRRKRSISFSAP